MNAARKLQADLRRRLDGPPRHVTVPSWRDGLADLAAELRAIAAELPALQAGLRRRLDGPPRHVTIRSWRPSLPDLDHLAAELRAFLAELRAHKGLCILVGAASFGGGLAITVGLALLWSLFL